MATTTYLTNPTVTVNSVDFTDQCTSLELTFSKESEDVTAFGDTARKYTGKLENNQVTMTLFLSYGSGEVEVTLEQLVGTVTNLVMKAGPGAKGANNPEYTLTGAFLETFTPITGSVGELSTVDVTFTGGTLARSVS
jgi:hypothetical protein